MTKLTIFYGFNILFFFTFFGCVPSTTVTRIYLQEVEVHGPMNSSPVHITDSSESGITISPRIAFNTKNTLNGKKDQHTLVNSQGVFQVDTVFNSDGTFYFQETLGANKYPFEGKNFTWYTPDLTTSLDIDFKISKSFAIFAGGNYSVVEQKSVWGGLFGIGLMGAGKDAAFRFDIGLSIQEIPYNAYTIVSVTNTGTSGTYNYVADYYDISSKTQYNPFAALTINSFNRDWLFNIFLNAGYRSQSLINFTPEDQVYHNPSYYPFYYGDVYITEDNRGEATAGIIDITPGLYFNFGDTGRILLGAKFNWIVQIEDLDYPFQVIPMLQFDFTL
jgi:hypothetical protein